MEITGEAGLPLMSLSARRAWIEIITIIELDKRYFVALRKESVDRNKRLKMENRKLKTSLSARRAWIEILTLIIVKQESNGRSPQGERG